MTTQTITKNQREILKPILRELKEINAYLKKLLIIIPEESLKEYKHPSQIRNFYLKSIRAYPPKD